MKLTANFTLEEFIEGEMPKEAIRLNYDLITVEQRKNIGLIANELQKLRDKTKAEFGSKFSGFKITSGLRQKEWELKQGRSGNSQHTKGSQSRLSALSRRRLGITDKPAPSSQNGCPS